jgi:hypothetical protein
MSVRREATHRVTIYCWYGAVQLVSTLQGVCVPGRSRSVFPLQSSAWILRSSRWY